MKGNVLVVGLGLIGGSLALAIRNKHSQAQLVGYDTSKTAMEQALALNVIDEQATSFRQGAERADLIILATPVLKMEKLIKQLLNMNLKPNVIITDTGSTKNRVMELASSLSDKGITFIGGHPMAGSHKTGVESAKAHLFENAYFILTPDVNTSSDQLEDLKQWLQGTNSHFLVIDTTEHDYVTGVISHFPHIVAAGLVNLTNKQAEVNPLVHSLAAGGFRDLTRIASSNPNMWTDIVKQNQTNVLHLLDNWMIEMENIRAILKENDDEKLARFFEDAKDYRDSMPIHSQGAIPAYYDLYVDVIDVPGVIASVTSLLAEESISITNLNIMEAREGLLGVLRISFQTDEDQTQAKLLLEQHDYQIYETT